MFLISLPEHSHLKITPNRVVKSRISVNNSSSSRVTQNLQITDHEEQFNKITFHGLQNRPITHHGNTPVRPSPYTIVFYPSPTRFIFLSPRDSIKDCQLPSLVRFETMSRGEKTMKGVGEG